MKVSFSPRLFDESMHCEVWQAVVVNNLIVNSRSWANLHAIWVKRANEWPAPIIYNFTFLWREVYNSVRTASIHGSQMRGNMYNDANNIGRYEAMCKLSLANRSKLAKVIQFKATSTCLWSSRCPITLLSVTLAVTNLEFDVSIGNYVFPRCDRKQGI